MAVPGFQAMMYPILDFLIGQDVRTTRDTVEYLEDYFKLSEDERSQLLASGRARLASNRANWAITHLSKAGCIKRTGRGLIRIDDRGLDAHKALSDVKYLDMRYLRQFPEYREFAQSGSNEPPNVEGAATGVPEDVETPEELIEREFQRLNSQLASSLLEQTLSITPQFFEQLVVQLLVAMGYGGSLTDAAKAVGRSGDDGIDGIIKEDKLGLDVVYIQAKRWQGVVGRPTVQGFAGSLEGYRARKGVFITTSSFTKDAHDYVSRIEKKIVLIDGQLLTNLMIEHGVGVTDVQSYQIKKIDSDYFEP